MRIVVFSLVVLLAGCSKMDKVFDWFQGVRTNLVVLESQPFNLTDRPMMLTGAEPITVLGDQANICFVVATGVPLSDRTVMDARFNEALKGATITVTFRTRGAPEFVAPATSQAWSLYGNIGSGNELSACASLACSNLPVGTQIESFSVTASQPVALQGAYWKSSNRFGASGA